MNDLRSPMDDRPYRPTDRQTRMIDDDDAMTTAEYYRSRLDAVRQSRWFPLASVCAAVLIFSGIVSYAYKQGAQNGVNATTPVVESTEMAFKEKPANPGGMDVPFQDAIVFDQLQSADSGTSGETIESLLPPPEQPVATELAQDNNTQKTVTGNDTVNTANAVVDPVVSEPQVSSTPQASSAPQASEAVLKQTAPESDAKTVSDIPTVTAEKTSSATEQKAAEQQVAKKMDQVAPAAPSPATANIVAGNYRVQLGAFRDEAAARAAWNTFQTQYAPQLTGVTPDFPRADLGAKGIFYRVHGKNLSKASADSICKAINAQRSGSCMVTQ